MTPRPTLAHYGPARGGVRVVQTLVHGVRVVRCEWYEHGLRRVKTWPDTREARAEAKAWAKGFAEARVLAPYRVTAPLTTRQLWDKYGAAEFPHLRPRTRELYAEHWRRWEVFVGMDTAAATVGPDTVDEFRARLRVIGIATGHQQRIVRDVRTVYTWGHQRRLLEHHPLAGYRFKRAKEDRPTSPAAYTTDDLAAILAQWQPQARHDWRPWCAVVLAAYQGARMRAILHLRWEDLDLARGLVTWRAAYDKTGTERTQPLTLAGYCAALTALHWRVGDTPWVFPSPWAAKRAGREAPGVYGAQALWLALRQAETTAGIAHQAYRAMHGFRRGVGKRVAQMTGDPMRGLGWLGDVDPKMIPVYVQGTQPELTDSAALLDGVWAAR